MVPLEQDRTVDSNGFTLLELVLVLFLLSGLLTLVIPRISFGDNASGAARKWVGTLRTLQELGIAKQKPIHLYVDIDRGTYWPMTLEGNEEKPFIDPIWAQPLTLPETVRFADVQVGAVRKESGRADLWFYPNGRIDQATIYLADANNDVIAVHIEPVTARIRLTDQPIESPQPLIIPNRIRPLLDSVPTGLQSPLSGVKQ